MTRTLLLLNGPNLSRLGRRKPEIYGTATLENVVDAVRAAASTRSWDVVARQSEHEGVLVEAIHAADGASAIVINPGALMMAGWSLRDALEDYAGPVIEVHISNLWAREPFRHTSVLSPVVTGVVVGLGIEGYTLATHAATSLVEGTMRKEVQ